MVTGGSTVPMALYGNVMTEVSHMMQEFDIFPSNDTDEHACASINTAKRLLLLAHISHSTYHSHHQSSFCLLSSSSQLFRVSLSSSLLFCRLVSFWMFRLEPEVPARKIKNHFYWLNYSPYKPIKCI